MWAQSWVNLYDRIKPYENSSDLDITASLKRNNFTALKIFQESDHFYQSLGLEPNTMSYTGFSMIENPKDRLIVCHASAWVWIHVCRIICIYNEAHFIPFFLHSLLVGLLRWKRLPHQTMHNCKP